MSCQDVMKYKIVIVKQKNVKCKTNGGGGEIIFDFLDGR